MNKKSLTFSTVGIAAAIALAGCSGGSGGSPTTTGSAPGSAPATASASSGSSASSAPVAGEHNVADTMFAQQMIPHHAQAVQMSDLMLAKKDIPADVTALAKRIRDAQAPEIETMAGWLKSWNEPTEAAGGRNMSTHGSGMGGMDGMDGMGGMMSDADLQKLDAAQGTEAAKLFLTQMTVHHQGAIMMARMEERNGRNPDAVALAKTIHTAQQKEIQEMKDLLAAL